MKDSKYKETGLTKMNKKRFFESRYNFHVKAAASLIPGGNILILKDEKSDQMCTDLAEVTLIFQASPCGLSASLELTVLSSIQCERNWL